jgi:hypothetical protein
MNFCDKIKIEKSANGMDEFLAKVEAANKAYAEAIREGRKWTYDEWIKTYKA